MEETDHNDPHESMADAAACGLAAALLLLFSILTAAGQSKGTVPAQLQLAVAFTFETNLPAPGATATAVWDGKVLCTLLPNGELQPGKDCFAADQSKPGGNVARNLFANQTALFGTPLGEKPAVTFTADRLSEGKPNAPSQKQWSTKLSIQFAKKPRDIEVAWTFGPGFLVESVKAELVPTSAKASDGPPLMEVINLKKRSGVRIMAGTASLALVGY